MTLDLESVVPAKLTAVAVFTRDLLLEVAPDGNGSSGNWVIDPTARFDRVVIYNRRTGDRRGAEIIVAQHIETIPSATPGRYVIKFRRAKPVGTTELSWPNFARTGTNPIRTWPPN